LLLKTLFAEKEEKQDRNDQIQTRKTDEKKTIPGRKEKKERPGTASSEQQEMKTIVEK